MSLSFDYRAELHADSLMSELTAEIRVEQHIGHTTAKGVPTFESFSQASFQQRDRTMQRRAEKRRIIVYENLLS